MDRLTVTMADGADGAGLDKQWGQVLQTGTYDGETYTPTDLDGMVSEYQRRRDSEKAPVMLGIASRDSSQPVGKIEALRRTGNSLQAKFAGIDPRVEQLHGRGAFPKKSVQLKRTPNGVSLQGVGLISPVWRGYWKDDETPSLDALMSKHFGKKEHTFQENALGNQWLELFQSGDYGEKGRYSDSDLDQIVRNFDPSFHEPPVVIGHPEHDAPAYGWVEGLKRNGDKLLGKFKQVDPQFEDMVKSGRLKKRSISLYQSANGWMLRHVGFLGAQPPEVKGLPNASFKEDRIRFVTLTFGESESRAEAAIARLKSSGYWMPEFDHFEFPVLFAELEGSPTLGLFVSVLEKLQDECGIDSGSVRLACRAKNYARFHGVSFNEALDQVQERQKQETSSSRAVDAGMVGARLSQFAHERMWSRNISFGEALSEVAAENPDLTR